MKIILKKVLVMILFIIISLCVLDTTVKATDDTYVDKLWKTFNDSNNWNSDSNVEEKTTNFFSAAVVAIKIIAVSVAIIMLLVLAMKYMMSAPSDKAEIKKHAVVYVIGAVILFATTGILSLIQSFSSSLNSGK